MTSSIFVRSDTERAASDPITGLYPYPNRTLAELRQSLMIRLGFAAQLAYPPAGMPELLNELLQDAQRQLYLRYPMLRKESWYTWSLFAGYNLYDPFLQDGAGGVDTTILCPQNVRGTSSSPGIAHPGSGNYFYYRVSSTNAFGETVPCTEIMVVGGSPYPNTLTWTPVIGANGYKVYGRASRGGELLIATITDPSVVTYVDTLVSTPAGAMPTTNTTGGLVSQPLMDPDTVKAGYLVDAAGTWTKLTRGINPGLYTGARQGRPYCYSIRGSIEVFPTPDLSTYKLYLYAEQGLQAFAADADVCSMDHEAVLLMALGNAKEHYGQNASTIWRQLEVFIGKKTHATHGGRRYVPNPPAMTTGHVLLGDEAMIQPRGTFR
jgi:hypothetical protein